MNIQKSQVFDVFCVHIGMFKMLTHSSQLHGWNMRCFSKWGYPKSLAVFLFKTDDLDDEVLGSIVSDISPSMYIGQPCSFTVNHAICWLNTHLSHVQIRMLTGWTRFFYCKLNPNWCLLIYSCVGWSAMLDNPKSCVGSIPKRLLMWQKAVAPLS